MSPHEEHGKRSEHSEGGRCDCPMCRMMHALGGAKGRTGPFWEHLTNARIEVLRAVRSLIDERIDHLEKKKSEKDRGKKAVKIDVE